jgi:serine acetyltransferase/CelD/BcsL family acetyltransferase involved in cellulose biosynthesis
MGTFMNALSLYRFGHWCYQRRIPLVPTLIYRLIYLLHHAVIPMSVEIGEGSELAYGGLGTVLHERCKIGKFVTIGHQVSIGGRSRRWGVPIIEDRCVIGAGAILLGPISIGAESVIGANAVVLQDVPPKTVVAGAPATVVRKDIDIMDYTCLQPPEEAEALSFRSTDNLLVTVIEDASRLRHLADEWTELLSDSDADCVFLTREWLETWWEHFSAGRILAVATVRRNSQLLGLAPFFAQKTRFGGVMPYRSLQLLGTGLVGSDYLDVVIRRGHERQVSRSLAEYFASRRLVMTLSHLKSQGNLAAGLVSELKQAGWNVQCSTVDVCPHIPLKGHTWESYLAGLGSQHRYNFNRRLKNFQKQGTLQLDVVEKEDQRQDALRTLIDLHNLRWDERGGSETLQSPAMHAFHDAFTRRALERGWLRLFILRLDGCPIGALYGLLYGGRFYFYQSGFDPAYRQHSVGLVTMGLAIKQAIKEGAESYDLLHGTERYKFLWAKDSTELVRLHLYPPCLGGRLCRGAVVLEDGAKSVARRVLPPAVLDFAIAWRRGGILRSSSC